MRSPGGQFAFSRALENNRSGRSITFRTICCITFFLSNFALIGALHFPDAPNIRTSLVIYLAVQSALALAGMILPWRVLFFLFQPMLRGTENEAEGPERQQFFSYEKNLQSLELDSMGPGSAPPPLIQRSFTVLKAALRPSAKPRGEDFQVLGARNPGDASIRVYDDPNSTTAEVIFRNQNLNSTRSGSLGSKVSRQGSTASRTPSRSSSRRDRSDSDTTVVRITHPMESLTAHQGSSQRDTWDYFTNPVPPSRMSSTRVVAERSSELRPATPLPRDPTPRRWGDTLTGLGEEHFHNVILEEDGHHVGEIPGAMSSSRGSLNGDQNGAETDKDDLSGKNPSTDVSCSPTPNEVGNIPLNLPAYQFKWEVSGILE